MNFIDLFSGIGGFRLGMERAGHTCVGACEIDPSARAIYLKNFPNTEWFPHDITQVQPDDMPPADCWCGGFPCQDISAAGRGAGIREARSGLFYEIIRLARVVQPRLLFLENVPALLHRGMGDVLGELSQIGYDAEWEVISAAQVGAPHRRERVWIVAYPHGERCDVGRVQIQISINKAPEFEQSRSLLSASGVSADSLAVDGLGDRGNIRVIDGVPGWLDAAPRIKGLGNAVVPQVVEFIGRHLS